MKKFIALILCLALCVGMVACSGGGHTPAYGEQLVLSSKLKYKSEYKNAVSPETRQIISDYLTQMVAIYNSIDPEEEHDRYFVYTPYIYANRFYQEISPAFSNVAVKNALEEELTDKEQLFFDMIELIEQLSDKYFDVQEAMFPAEEEPSDEEGEPEDEQTTAPEAEEGTDEGDALPEDDEVDESAEDEPVTAKIPADKWEELFNLYVEIMNTFYTDPFVRP